MAEDADPADARVEKSAMRLGSRPIAFEGPVLERDQR